MNNSQANADADGDVLLTPSEVASLFRVSAKTVTRWARTGRLTSLRTLGGHRRFRSSEVHSLLAANMEVADYDLLMPGSDVG